MQPSKEREQKCYFLIRIFKEKKREKERERERDSFLLRCEFSIVVNSILRVNAEDNIIRNLKSVLCLANDLEYL